MATHYCTSCKQTLDVKQFYKSWNQEKYTDDGLLNTCKKCTTLLVDNWDPETFLPILQELDVPWVPAEWNAVLAKYGQDPSTLTGLSIIGRYLSKMRLKKYKDLRWGDSAAIAEEAKAKKIKALQEQGFNETEIAEELAKEILEKPAAVARPLPPPEAIAATAPAPASSQPVVAATSDNIFMGAATPHDIEIEKQLTEDEKTYLRLKWGFNYQWSELVQMEQLYKEMMDTYIIETPSHKDYLILICKTSLKANQLIDISDIEGFQKMSKVYDSLMKSAHFTESQRKEDLVEDEISSIGELAILCEQEGFIPRYYVDEPQDKVDRVIQDMQKYLHDLVTEELNLGNLIEEALQNLEVEKQLINMAALSGESVSEASEEALFTYDEGTADEDDYNRFAEFEEKLAEHDKKLREDDDE